MNSTRRTHRTSSLLMAVSVVLMSLVTSVIGVRGAAAATVTMAPPSCTTGTAGSYRGAWYWPGTAVGIYDNAYGMNTRVVLKATIAPIERLDSESPDRHPLPRGVLRRAHQVRLHHLVFHRCTADTQGAVSADCVRRHHVSGVERRRLRRHRNCVAGLRRPLLTAGSGGPQIAPVS